MLLVVLGVVGFSGMSVNAENVEIKSFEEAYEDAKNGFSDLIEQELEQLKGLILRVKSQNITGEADLIANCLYVDF